MRIPVDTMKISIVSLFNLVNTKNNIKETEGKNFKILIGSRGYDTFVTGLVPVLASHRMRQESSPTLQNSCALHDTKIHQKHHQESMKSSAFSMKNIDITRRKLF